MQVFTARTYEMNDVDYLCKELAGQIEENVTFGERTMGIAVCDSTIDCEAVMKKLSEMYSFDIYGATALAFIRIHSDEDISVSFMIITGNEELVGAMALSEPMTFENKERVLVDAYKLARERLGEDPKMMITLQPFSTVITPDYTTDILDKASGHVPHYGAVSSSDLETNVSAVYVNGVPYNDRMIINLLGGGIQPVFACATAEFVIPDKKAVITKSEGNVVYKVGEDSFLEFMGKNGLTTSPTHLLESCIATYASSPVIIYPKGSRGDGQKTRNITDIDFETGVVSFTGEMPEGYELAICVLTSDKVRETTAECFDELIAKIEANTSDQYRYSTLFSTSCGGRYLVMSGDTSLEGDYTTNNPVLKDLASCGFYAMGEICPVEDGDTFDNRSLHSSITLMAL